MATDKIEAQDIPTSYEFDCDSLPIPPGTKSFARLPRDGEPEPMPTRAWWLAGAIAMAALVVGLLIGRFLLA